MGLIIAIDPGCTESGYVVVRHDENEITQIVDKGKVENEKIFFVKMHVNTVRENTAGLVQEIVPEDSCEIRDDRIVFQSRTWRHHDGFSVNNFHSGRVETSNVFHEIALPFT